MWYWYLLGLFILCGVGLGIYFGVFYGTTASTPTPTTNTTTTTTTTTATDETNYSGTTSIVNLSSKSFTLDTTSTEAVAASRILNNEDDTDSDEEDSENDSDISEDESLESDDDSDSDSEDENDGDKVIGTMTAFDAQVSGIYIPTSRTDGTGITLMGSPDKNKVITAADLTSVTSGVAVSDEEKLVKTETHEKKTAERLVILAAYVQVTFTVQDTEFKVRVATSDYEEMKKGDKLIEVGGEWNWYDDEAGTLTTTRPTNTKQIGHIAESTSNIHPFQVLLTRSQTIAVSDTTETLTTALNILGGRMLHFRANTPPTAADVLKRFKIRLKRHVKRPSRLGFVGTLTFTTTTS